MPSAMELQEYLDDHGSSPFGTWFDAVDTAAALKIRTALARLETGNLSALKPVGQGVHEVRIDFGSGYRVYVGMDGAVVVILLGGSTKARQAHAIADSQLRWKTYCQRKRRGA